MPLINENERILFFRSLRCTGSPITKKRLLLASYFQPKWTYQESDLPGIENWISGIRGPKAWVGSSSSNLRLVDLILFSNLTAWASNGVLLLNTCLTVRAGDAGSHSNRGWEKFTDKVVDVVDRYGGANISGMTEGSDSNGIGRGVVFLAWGAWAAKRVEKLNTVSQSQMFISRQRRIPSFRQNILFWKVL